MLSAVLSLGIPLAVKLVERLKGKGGGASKKALALGMVTAIVAQFAAPGVGLPGEHELAVLIESAVSALNKSGDLVGESTAIDGKPVDAELFCAGMLLLRRSGALRGE